jgi:signal transduction histidine kinase
MSLTEFLTLLTRGVFLLLAAVTLLDFLRHRDRTRLDTALVFGTLGFIFLVQTISAFTGAEIRGWLSTVNSILLLAHPYLLLRLVQHFRAIPPVVRWIAIAGMLLSWLILIVSPTPLPPPLTILVVLYFVFVEVYVAVAFVRGARATTGVTHWRLQLAALGTGLFAVTILLAGINAVVQGLGDALAALVQFSAMLAGVAYYFGFAPPRWLRRMWQFTELYRFLSQSGGRPVEERATDTLPQLCVTAMRATGGLSAFAAIQEQGAQHLTIRASAGEQVLSGTLAAQSGTIGRAWQTKRPTVAYTPADFSQEGAQLAAQVGASASLVVPIGTGERIWGLLGVYLRRTPLFAADDVELLTLFAEQAAIVLSYAEALDERGALIAQLRGRTGELEAANQELEAFSYSVSHDLRAPLRAVDGFSRILQEDYAAQFTGEAERYLRLIRENAQLMGRLVDGLLTFSRLGRQPLKKQPVEIGSLVQEVLASLRHTQDGRRIDVSVADLPSDYADPTLLRQVFANLLDNAVKFTRQREVAVIEVGSRPITDDGQQTTDDSPPSAARGAKLSPVVYYVRDNGVGFDVRYADKLFGVFQRLHPTEDYEGDGVGLAIVQRIIHRHGGRIWAESGPDQGTTFYFTLGGDQVGD